jgi:drug/metabolite transporter (DMT)-like permease
MSAPERLTAARKSIIGYACAFTAAALFGSVSTIAKPLVSDVSPLLLSSVVYLVAAGALSPFVMLSASQSRRIAKNDYGLLAVVGVCGAAIAPVLFFTGLQQTPAFDSALLSNGEIVFTIILAIAFFKERLTPIGIVAVLLVITGLVVVTTNLEFTDSVASLRAGHLLILGATAFWALDNNLSRLLSTRIDAARIVQLKSAIGGTLLLAVALAIERPTFDLSHLPYVVLLGILGFAASLFFFLKSLSILGTIRTILIYSLSSVFGLALAAVLLGENISIYQMVSVAIMLLGIYLVNMRKGIETEQKTHKGGDSAVD